MNICGLELHAVLQGTYGTPCGTLLAMAKGQSAAMQILTAKGSLGRSSQVR